MSSPVPKVLHRICGVAMIEFVARTARQLRPERTVIVTGKDREGVSRAVGTDRVLYAVQDKPKGTAHALSCALPALRGFRGVVVVMNGDTPLLSPRTISRFLRLHKTGRNALSVLSFAASNPSGYGRIVRDRKGQVIAIVEDKDADAEQKRITEVNSGVYAINHDVLPLIDAIRINRAKGEYYLTDIVAAAHAAGLRTGAGCIGGEEEFMGINTRTELHQAAAFMRKKIVSAWIEKGVGFVDPNSVFIHPDAVIGKGTVIHPNVHIEGSSRIGRGATIYPNVRITDSVIGDSVTVRDSSVIEGSRIRALASVGPFAHLRPGSDVGAGARIGNFVELKKARVGAGSKASHLSYLGDAVIGRGVNIGAGAITCNYDGVRKHVTVIGDNVFIGSDTQLVAPVRVGKGSYVGAGSTITKDVPPGALAVSRIAQKNISGWAKKKKSSPKGKGGDGRRGA